MVIIKIVLVAWLLLLIGDFLSTFLYHVPEHIFGKFHSIVHHSKNRSFIHYAVFSKNFLVLYAQRWKQFLMHIKVSYLKI